MPTWARASHVAAKLGYGEITATSSPSTDDVDDWLDDAEAQVRQILDTLGLSSVLAAGSDEVRVAKAKIVDYAAAEVIATWGVQRPELLDEALVRRERWESYLEELRSRPASLGAELDPDGQIPESQSAFRSTFTGEQRVQMAEVYD